MGGPAGSDWLFVHVRFSREMRADSGNHTNPNSSAIYLILRYKII